MSDRRIGLDAARDVATRPSLDAALTALTATPYARDVQHGQALAVAQRAVVETMVWNCRVLAGWSPRGGAAMLRLLIAPLEAANIEDHVRALGGADVPPPYRLGSLSTAWSKLARTTSTAELHRVLAASPWGDPGDSADHEIGLTIRAILADRMMAAVPAAARWAAGRSALLVARECVVAGRTLPARARLAMARVLGQPALSARSLPALVAALPASSRWVLDDINDPVMLWHAETRWWAQVERDALGLTRRPVAGPEVLVGAVALVTADAWRVRGALELAARGGSPLEAFDALG